MYNKSKSYRLLFIFIIPLIMLQGEVMFSGNIDSIYNIKTSPPFLNSNQEWVDSVMETLSLEEKIAQSFMIVAYSDKTHENFEYNRKIIEKHKVGGIIFLKGSPYRQAMLTNQYQELSKVPLLIGLDAEWGLAMRLDSTVKYPEQMMLGALQNNRLIYQMGRQIAMQLKRIGVHINFAPVADVNNNPDNPVINSRSFGEDKENVVSRAMAYMLGLQDNHILATAKHFPGHGDTKFDSHKTLPVIPHDRERLDSVELFPFKQLIDIGIGGMMVAHLEVPALDSTPGVPTTLSPAVINDLLKKELGFEGIVISDALNMQGVTGVRSPGDIETEAYLAGNDILLLPNEIPKAIASIKRAMRRNKISMEEINHKCQKILSLKAWTGLDNYQPVKLSNLTSDLNHTRYHHLNRKLNEKAMTLLHNKDSLIPLKRLDTLNIASLSIGTDTLSVFQQYLSKYGPMDHYYLPKESDYEEFFHMHESLSAYNLILLSVHDTHRWPSGNFGITDNTIAFMDSVSKNKNTISTLFANPYVLSSFQNLHENHALIMGYEDTRHAQAAAAELIFGGILSEGKLPVTAEQRYQVNDGITTDSITRLKYSYPEEVGIDSESLNDIDSIINYAIYSYATPGCQVLLAKDGVVFYDKSFGCHTYNEKTPVTDQAIYDIASITKIAATLPVLMSLQEKGQFSIDDSLGTYLPELEDSNKSGLIIEDILTHQSRLKPWIPFYFSLFEPLYKDDKLISHKFSKNYPFQISSGAFLNKNYVIKEGYLSGCQTDSFNIQIADNLYIHNTMTDTIYEKIRESGLEEKTEYKYSDLGYYYFYKIIENLSGKEMEDLVDSLFYRPLGCYHTTYLPLQKFDNQRIVPTENDIIFRKQLIKGHVHDPGAAMLGGVCGHAGLFSNANDLSKIMQMYLNKGTYGSQRYFKKGTIELFTSCPNCEEENRRGIGFDKPEGDELKVSPAAESTPLSSFGHTGFTGTMAWADPDNNLLYIFLSNRIHPDQYNRKLIKNDIRTKIQEVVYKSMKKP